MSNIFRTTVIYLISLLIILAWWSSLTIGLSTDEYFHHINGMKRFNFLVSLGEYEKIYFRNSEFYPGLYDTLSYALGQIILLINKKFYANNIDFVMHVVNVSFSTLSILGLYLFSKKIFNRDIALLTIMLTLFNPFFFGHMGMNSKDLIIFFSLIWFCYYFYLYCTEESDNFKYLLLFSFFVGFGSGVRLTFAVVIFPVVVCGIIFLIKKYKDNYLKFYKRLLTHIPVTIFITIFLVVLCWPHIFVAYQNDNLGRFLSIIFKATMNWNDGPKIGLMNGEYYEVFNTPKTYFIDIIFYRLPIYFTFLIILSYIFYFLKKIHLKNEISFLNQKFLIINVVAFFPILLALVLGVNIYDNLRLFLFTIPFFCLIASFSLYQIIKNFNFSWKEISLSITLVIMFSLSFYRFVSLTPYQYDYVNFSSLKLSHANTKWEHDYWGASYKELVHKIKDNLNDEEIKNLKITNCSGDDTLLYYLFRNLGKKFIYRNKREYEATHAVIINRTTLDVINNPLVGDLVDETGAMKITDMERVVRTPGVKTRCPVQYKGEDIVTVTRNGIVLSSLRKLEN